MSAPIKAQIIKQGDKPVFAVIPWEDYQKLIAAQKALESSEVYFPHEVVKYNAMGDTLVKAWRKYLGLTQSELAAIAGMKQSALSRIEAGKNKPKSETLRKLAKAMNIQIVQLIE